MKSSRRTLLKSFLIGLAAPFLNRLPAHSNQSQGFADKDTGTPTPAINPTAAENQKDGTKDWQLTNPARKREIEGYASLTSVNRGSQIKLFVNTKEPNYTIEIFRMGWYGGAGARRMSDPISLPGIRQPAPIEDQASGLIECNWNEPYILEIPYNPNDPTDWASGVYLAKLTAGKTGKQSYIIFVVRDDNRKSDILFQSSVTTYQAYNNWGGKSLYRWNSKSKQAYKVSFNRPYAASPNPNAAYGVGAGEFLTNVQPPRRTSNAGWEYNMVRWLEREGYDITYATNVDIHFNSYLLPIHKVFLSVGHDEYWSWEMRQSVESARDKGVSLGFFSSNTCFWQIRFEPSRITRALNRTIVAYKEMVAKDPYIRDSDPKTDARATTLWRDKRVNRPEDALIGVMYETFQVDADIVIDNAPEWLLAGTNLTKGDRLPGLLGYEVDRMFGNAPKNTIRLCHSPYPHENGTRYADMTAYTTDSGALVFATGSMQWSWGLDDYNAPDLRSSRLNPAAEQITRNILAQMLNKS